MRTVENKNDFSGEVGDFHMDISIKGTFLLCWLSVTSCMEGMQDRMACILYCPPVLLRILSAAEVQKRKLEGSLNAPS